MGGKAACQSAEEHDGHCSWPPRRVAERTPRAGYERDARRRCDHLRAAVTQTPCRRHRPLHRTAAASAAAKKVSEEQSAAAAKKMSEEQAAAAAKKKFEEAGAGAAKKKSDEEAEAAVKLGTAKVTASNVVITLTIPVPGTVITTGSGLKRTDVTLAAGTHQVAVGLTKAGKAARKTRTKIKVSVSLKVGRRTDVGAETINSNGANAPYAGDGRSTGTRTAATYP